MKHITLHECYDTLEIKNQESLNSITYKESEELHKFIISNKLDKENIVWGRNTITFINYVGYIKLPSFSIEILPKIDLDIDDQGKTRKTLLNMLHKSGLFKVNYSEISDLNIYNQNLNEILSYLFAKNLQNELVRGIYLEYITKVENINVLKGKLMVTRHISNIATSKNKVFCEFEEFCIDNSLNQIFKCCIMHLLRNIKNSSTIKILKHCLAYFVDVSDIEIDRYELEKYSFSRLNKRFESTFILAKMLMSGYSSAGDIGQNKSFSILFKMEEVFEKYMGNLLTRNLVDSQVYTQHKKHKLLINEFSDKNIFQLKPDIVIESNGKQNIIIDTKWKKIQSSSNRHGVKRDDLYQMYAYLTRYPDAENVILLYPFNEFIDNKPGELLESWYLEENKNKKIRVYSISLCNENETIEQAIKIIKDNS